MARDFSKNLSNYMLLGINAIGPLVSGSAVVTISAWVQLDTSTSTANDNRIISILIAGTNNSGISLSINGTAAPKLRAGARSESGGTFFTCDGATNVTTGVWHHVAAVYNFSGDALTVYLDGVQDGTAAATFISSLYSPSVPTGNDMIGAVTSTGFTPGGTGLQFDGRIAELKVWKVGLSAGEIAADAKGISALKIRPSSLVVYHPLYGVYSPERNLVGSGPSGTITGTLSQTSHPPVASLFGSDLEWVFSLVSVSSYKPWLFGTEEES